MRRFLSIASLVLAVGLVVLGFHFLLKAVRAESWGAAGPAIAGVACLMVAAAFAGRPVTSVLTYPFTAFLGHLFYPQTHYTAPPKSLLLSLERRIADGRFRSAEQQIDALLRAYPKDADLVRLKEKLDAAKTGNLSRRRV